MAKKQVCIFLEEKNYEKLKNQSAKLNVTYSVLINLLIDAMNSDTKIGLLSVEQSKSPCIIKERK